MSMTKKSGPAAPKSAQSKAAKRRKTVVGKSKASPKASAKPCRKRKRKAGSLRVQRRKAPKRALRLPVEANGARTAIRKLRTQLARALKRIGELEASADTDFLLDIPNRRGFEREFQRAIAYIKRYDASGALIVLDVDRLKPINDAFGHAAGDQVLRAVAATLVREVRSSDVVGRLGGDEFAVLLWNLTETDARAKAASLEEAVDRLVFTFRGRNVTAGASAGVAVLGPQAEAGRAFEEADAAMYLRKAQRRHES
jgi:diguanylate cyclase (GGDEF)-like protein